MKLDTVRPIYEHAGPFVSLHLDVSRDTETGRQQIDSRWTTTRHELERRSIPGALIDQLEQRLREPTHVKGPVRRTIIATPEEVLFDDVRAGRSPWPETVEVGPLPDLAGWVSMADGQFPFLIVRADRLGADLELYLAANAGVAEAREVDGSDLHLTKVPDGDWAQDKFQQRAENQWHENAQLAVAAIEELLVGRGVQLVVIAGDVRARADIAQMLGERDDLTIVQTEAGGRAAGASDEALWAAVGKAVADVQAHAVDRVGQRLARGLAVAEGVVTGPDAVADALVKGAVEQLVLDLDDAHATAVSAADHPGLALPTAAEKAGELPADQVLIAAAALTDAEVSVVPHELPLPRELTLSSGVAALLRWDDRVQERERDQG